MPPKQNKTPQKSSGAPPKSPQTVERAQTQWEDWLHVTGSSGVLKYGRTVFRSFDDVYDFVDKRARGPNDQQRVLHQVLEQLNRHRYLVADTIMRFADLRDHLRQHNERFRNYLTDAEWEAAWQDLEGDIQMVRKEDKKIQPIYRHVCRRLGGEPFYLQYCAKWGKTRSTLQPLKDWLIQPTGDNITNKIRKITCATRDRCLTLKGTKGGISDSTIPQAQDIHRCIKGEVNTRPTTRADIAALKKRAKEKPQWSHVWLDEHTGIMYDVQPQQPIPADLPTTCDSQEALPPTSPGPSGVQPAGALATPSQAQKRRVSPSDVTQYANVTKHIRALSAHGSPAISPPTSANLSTLRFQVPVQNPTELDRIVWQWVVSHSEYVVRNGHRPLSYPKPAEIRDAPITEFNRTLNNLGAGIDHLPEAIRGSTVVLLSEGLLFSAELSREAREADTLRKMYEMLHFWQTRWPLNPGAALQRPVPLEPNNDFGLTARSFEELIRDEAHDGFMGHEVVRAGITVRASGEAYILDDPEWQVFQQTCPRIRDYQALQALRATPHTLTRVFSPAHMPRFVFFIIGRHGNHFALGWARPATGEYGLLDSDAARTSDAQDNRERQMVNTWLSLAFPFIALDRWTELQADGPQQTSADCGVHAITNAWHLIGNGMIDTLGLGQGDPLELRCQIMHEILSHTRLTETQMAGPGNVPALPPPQASNLSQPNLSNIPFGSNPETRQRQPSVATGLSQLGLSPQSRPRPTNVPPHLDPQRQPSQSSVVDILNQSGSSQQPAPHLPEASSSSTYQRQRSQSSTPDPLNVLSSPCPPQSQPENVHRVMLEIYNKLRAPPEAESSNPPTGLVQPSTPKKLVYPAKKSNTPRKAAGQGQQGRPTTSTAPVPPMNPPSTPTSARSGQQIRETLPTESGATTITPRRSQPQPITPRRLQPPLTDRVLRSQVVSSGGLNGSPAVTSGGLNRLNPGSPASNFLTRQRQTGVSNPDDPTPPKGRSPQ